MENDDLEPQLLDDVKDDIDYYVDVSGMSVCVVCVCVCVCCVLLQLRLRLRMVVYSLCKYIYVISDCRLPQRTRGVRLSRKC